MDKRDYCGLISTIRQEFSAGGASVNLVDHRVATINIVRDLGHLNVECSECVTPTYFKKEAGRIMDATVPTTLIGT